MTNSGPITTTNTLHFPSSRPTVRRRSVTIRRNDVGRGGTPLQIDSTASLSASLNGAAITLVDSATTSAPAAISASATRKDSTCDSTCLNWSNQASPAGAVHRAAATRSCAASAHHTTATSASVLNTIGGTQYFA